VDPIRNIPKAYEQAPCSSLKERISESGVCFSETDRLLLGFLRTQKNGRIVQCSGDVLHFLSRFRQTGESG
jgi:hypothetical protein